MDNKINLIKLLNQSGIERQVLPKRTALYRLLRIGQSALKSFGKRGRPLLWISGSPFFFYRHLEAKLIRDQLSFEGLLLKPFKTISYQALLKAQFRNAVYLLKSQIGYKLNHLFQHRLYLPRRFKELLLGDSSEMDPLIYDLYAGVLEGRINRLELAKVLTHFKVPQIQQEAIDKTVSKILKDRPPKHYGSGVFGILIHHIPHTSRLNKKRYSTAPYIQGDLTQWIKTLVKWKILTLQEGKSLQ